MNSSNQVLVQRLFWRLHFWSGLLTAPIVLFAALSGILYIFTPQIESIKHAHLDRANTTGVAQNLDQQIQAATTQFNTKNLRSIVPAYRENETTQVIFGESKKAMQGTEHTQHQAVKKITEHSTDSPTIIAYIDPASATVQGSIAEEDRFKNWSRKLHSTMLQGDAWRWIIELGASWLLIMMITGIYLWWPRGKATWIGVLFWERGNTRNNWRYFHGITSIVLGLITLTIILTGLTWSKYAGENFRSMQKVTGQNAPRAPMTLHSTPIEGAVALSLQAIYEKAKQQVPDIQLQITPPKGENGVWRIENFDRSQPTKRFQLQLDAYSGAVLYQAGWQQIPLLAQATAVGIPFHRGEFGWWNQALLVLVGLAVIFSVISGFVMWLQRRKALSISAPKIESKHVRAVPWWMWLTLLGLGFALPVLGVSLGVLILFEMAYLVRRRTMHVM
ncbi:MAG: PepSY domain-containing protein [Undibacterium sp.]|nr:PepSY domain-containing protein [Undibacterium sp.]